VDSPTPKIHELLNRCTRREHPLDGSSPWGPQSRILLKKTQLREDPYSGHSVIFLNEQVRKLAIATFKFKCSAWSTRLRLRHFAEHHLVQHYPVWLELASPRRIRQMKPCWTFSNYPSITYSWTVFLDSAPNNGPLITRWELDKFIICWNKSFRTSKILTLLYQQFSNLLISQRDMSGPRLGALSNIWWSRGYFFEQNFERISMGKKTCRGNLDIEPVVQLRSTYLKE
jgi:hypothetical protein